MCGLAGFFNGQVFENYTIVVENLKKELNEALN